MSSIPSLQPASGGTPAARAGGALGIYAKNSSAPPVGEHGEVLPPQDLQSARIERYRLKSVVNRLLPDSRTAKCMRWRLPGQQVSIKKSVEYDRAFWAGLQVCASVWACPVCAAKIAERRRSDLVEAVSNADSQGLGVFLMTLTVPHGLGDDLDSILNKLQEAWRYTSSTRAGDKARKAINLAGTIRALEVTDGANGFHPHFHVLLFTTITHLPETIQQRFSPLWQQACEKAGLPRPSDQHGCNVQRGEYAASYVSKWGIEDEMTKGHIKRSRSASGLSMWDHLRSVFDTGCKRSAARFATFARAFKGRRQLVWSKGLRDRLSLGQELSDEVLAVQEREPAIELASLTHEDWKAILATKSEADVLSVAEKTPHALQIVIAGIRSLHESTCSKKTGDKSSKNPRLRVSSSKCLPERKSAPS